MNVHCKARFTKYVLESDLVIQVRGDFDPLGVNFYAVVVFCIIICHRHTVKFALCIGGSSSHCLRMNYYGNFLEGMGSNGFHIK